MGQRDGFSSQDIEKINRMYSCKGSSGQQSITPVTTRPGSGISPIAITPNRPSPIAGAGTGPVLFPSNPPSSGTNYESMSGSSLSQRPSPAQAQRPTQRPTQNPIANFFGNLISGFNLGDEEEGAVNGTKIETEQ